EARAILAAQIAEGRRLLATESVETETVTVQHQADMRFVGQTHVLTVPIARTDFSREELADTFERAYRDRFGVELREMRALVMSLRTAVIAHRRPIALDGLRGTPTPGGPVATRKVWFDSQSNNWHDTPIYRREGLSAGSVLTGPAPVEELDAPAGSEAGGHAGGAAVGALECTVPAGGAAPHLPLAAQTARRSG